MKKMIFIAAFAVALMSCTAGPSVPERFSPVTDTLAAGKHFALVDMGGEEEALLVTDYVYHDWYENMPLMLLLSMEFSKFDL